MREDIVSIIMPNYNTAEYVENSIWSVLNQTYGNLELIIVDDMSYDNSKNIIKKLAMTDSRINLICLDENKGAANARNLGIDLAKGRYIAFIDSDDIWAFNKLEKQLKFMKDKKISFVASYYDYIDYTGKRLDRIVRGKITRNYWDLLKDCPGNSTIIYDSQILGKTFVPLIKKRNDYLMWINVIKKAKLIYVIPDILVHYRIRSNSLSYNKKDLIKYHWRIYRNYEKLNVFKSSYLIFHLVRKGVIRKLLMSIKQMFRLERNK
ncbi:glycosyltransferase family 2 protein [Leuconostoc falkenbergense]|uniref:Glycosyltransferase family 2 protein n=1 Tax=Leuconostoc falkenbergense TaxID=2766470 RepID=A0A9X3E8A5_9LACO|nr:glycosyltransferase family 2 protein [Leuconostoc falkenbergense]MCX7578421.1 glycosyltransferase family 2 protein [Leuconostoc falkenbergense]